MIRARSVFDASAVLRALIGQSEDAIEALERDDRRLAPDLLYAESANTLVKYGRAGKLAWNQGDEVLQRLLAIPLEIVPSRSLVPAALTISRERELSAYDACYVALAEAHNAVLVTADRRLAAAYDRSELVA